MAGSTPIASLDQRRHRPGRPDGSSDAAVVLVPVKSFELAKGRLSRSLPGHQRSRLARQLAETVVRAAGSLPTIIVCDNHEVARWAAEIEVDTIMVEPRGLNAALTEAVSNVIARGHRRAIISHADLPLANDLTWLADSDGSNEDRSDDGGTSRTGGTVIIVPDRHGQGTNVLSIPLDHSPRFVFRYGPGSAPLHVEEARRVGLPHRVVPDDRLGWDLDTPEDLARWLDLGTASSKDSTR